MDSILIYLSAVNLLALLVVVYDKHAAINRQWRVRERDLFLLAFCGGAAGMLLGMHWIRHKTKHAKFMVGLPLMIIVQLLLVYTILYQ